MSRETVPRYQGVVRGFVAYHTKELPSRTSTRRTAVFIDEIVVARRGRGLGPRLLSYFRGSTVELRVHFNNKGGAALYSKLGFQRCMGETSVASKFGYDDKRGFRCNLCRSLRSTAEAADGELTHFDSWKHMPVRVRRDIRSLTHRAHRSYTEQRVRNILTPPAEDGPPCRFIVAMKENAS